jgi:hypothetical protein
MAKSARNSASQRTYEWRNSQKEQGNKQISCWLHSSIIKSLDAYSKQNNHTRNDVLVSAIEQFLEKPYREHTSDAADTEPEYTAYAKDSIHAMQQLVDSLNQQIQIKDHQINELIESTKQSNMLLGGMQKAMGLLDAPKEDHVKTPSKKSKGKGPKNKKKTKKK